MSIVELETRKAHLAREILNETDEGRVQEWMHFFYRTTEKGKQNGQSQLSDEQYCIDERKELDKLLDRHLISLKSFKFNRDEANDYD